MAVQAGVRTGSHAAAAGTPPPLVIHSFIHSFICSFMHSSKLGAGIAALMPLSLRTRLEQDGIYALVLGVVLSW